MDKQRKQSRAMSLSADWEAVLGAESRVSKSAIHQGFRMTEKPSFHFVTHSSYKGQWNLIGMSGFGTYVLPHKVEYEGQLVDSMFDGEGTLEYPMEQKIEGVWEKDVLVSFKYLFKDGLPYEEPWSYCQMPDRRYWTSIKESLRPAGRELLTNNFPARNIPEGCYDTGDGFFNPKTKCVVSAIDPDKIIRICTLAEEEWIIANCRKAWDEAVGFRPDLYERWITGRSSEEYSAYEESEVEERKINSSSVDMLRPKILYGVR